MSRLKFMNMISGTTPELTQDEICYLSSNNNVKIRGYLFSGYSYDDGGDIDRVLFPSKTVGGTTGRTLDLYSVWNNSSKQVEIETYAFQNIKQLVNIISPKYLYNTKSGITISGTAVIYDVNDSNRETLIMNDNIRSIFYGGSKYYYCNTQSATSSTSTWAPRSYIGGVSGSSASLTIGTDHNNISYNVSTIPGYLASEIKLNGGNITLPSTVTAINNSAFNFKNIQSGGSLTIPASVTIIHGHLFLSGSATSLDPFTLRFNHPSGATISLPKPGSDTGMVYSKNSYNLTVYTDNATIKNYAWATDNANATIYHLNGTSW